MIIKFLDKQYEVIQRLRTTGTMDLYVARDLAEEGEQQYMLACIRDSTLIKELIPITTKMNTSLSFKDLRGSFNADGKYYIVFDHAKGQTLQQILLENRLLFQERLQLAKNIFGQILMMNMPECFIYEVLRKDNIVVDEALGVRFLYSFTEVDYYGQVDEALYIRRLYDLLKELFAKELQNKSSADLTRYLRELGDGKYAVIWDCYQAFDELCEHLTVLSDGQEMKPGRFWWKAWEWLKKKAPVIKTVLATALVLVAGAYLLINLPNPVLSDEGIAFEQIGTLEIEEQQNK